MYHSKTNIMKLSEIKNPYVAVGVMDEAEPVPTVQDIINAVSGILNIHEDNLKILRNRTPEFVLARQMCWYLIKEYKIKMKLKDMAKDFGGFDHTTVLHGIRAVQDLIDTDENVRMQYRIIKKKIKLNTKMQPL